MYALVIIRFAKPLDEVQKVTEAHRAWLKEWHARGVVLASGPFDPRDGGAILLRLPDAQTLAALRDGDPYITSGVASYETHVWAPTLGTDGLARL